MNKGKKIIIVLWAVICFTGLGLFIFWLPWPANGKQRLASQMSAVEVAERSLDEAKNKLTAAKELSKLQPNDVLRVSSPSGDWSCLAVFSNTNSVISAVDCTGAVLKLNIKDATYVTEKGFGYYLFPGSCKVWYGVSIAGSAESFFVRDAVERAKHSQSVQGTGTAVTK